MKTVFVGVITILLLISFMGCSNKSISNESQLKKNNNVAPKVTSNKSKYIDPQNVEWVTMQGGLHLSFQALFAEKDSKRINQIADLINNGTDKKQSTEDETSAINSRARPVGMVFKMTDGSTIMIWPSYIITTWQNGWSAKPRDDRFVLNIQDSGENEYFTVMSKEVANYLGSGWRKDMPVVEPFTIQRQGKNGENVTISGEGCTDNTVTIFLVKNYNEKYPVARITPVFGVWKWTWTVDKNIKTVDGKAVTLGKGKYGFGIQIGNSNYESGGIEIATQDSPAKNQTDITPVFTLAWDNKIYRISNELVEAEEIGDSIGTILRTVSPKVELNGDSASRVSEGPMGAYTGDKLFRIKGIDDTVAIAVKRPYTNILNGSTM